MVGKIRRRTAWTASHEVLDVSSISPCTDNGLTRSVPHGLYGAVFGGATNPAIWILLGVYYVRCFTVSPPRPSCGVDAGFVPHLLCSNSLLLAKGESSLLLPDTLIFCTVAVFGLFCFTLGGSARLTRAVQAVGFLTALGISVAHLIPYDFAFRVDGRQQLLAFIRQAVSPNATIAQDRSVGLPSRTDRRHVDSPGFLEQKIVSGQFAADVGSIDELRARGIRYVPVSKTDYGRFFRQTHKPTKSELTDYDRRKKFYERLFREGELLWECKAGLLPILQPQIRFYYLSSEIVTSEEDQPKSLQ